ncbi:MAG: TolC family protein [Bacteroidaceae bacterium]|nr:TolC family protein [Bacteroidaceae bacterium]
MRKSFILTLLIASLTANAQQPWTLKQCIDYALEHNISIKQQDLSQKQQEIQLSTARNSRLPSLSAGASQNFSFGRGLTADNTYTNTNTSSTSFSLGTDVPIFTGFQIPNNIKLEQLNLKAATADLETAKNNIRVNVAQAYVEILYDMEISEAAHRQVSIDSMQVERLTRLMENGKVSGVEVSQQKSTMAQSALSATQADNNLNMALLTLSQLLELPTPEGFSIARPDEQMLSESLSAELVTTPDEIYALAVQTRPEIEAEQYRFEGTERSIKIAQSGYYPQLSFSAGMGSNYYRTSGFKAKSFSKQLDNNFSQYIGLSLNIPIFNRFSTRNQVRSAKLNRLNQQYKLDNAKKTLYKEIQQAYSNGINAFKKYESSKVAEASAKDAFSLVTAKYENGKANITEFNESRNNWLSSVSNLIRARYEYLYACKLLAFYRGEDLNF